MPKPALTVASLIHDPELGEAVSRWLSGQQRYRLLAADPAADPVAELERLHDRCDAVLLQEGQFSSDVITALQQRGLLLPAVLIGEVSGQMEYHQDEVHLPADQLEQLTYSLDAAVTRFISRIPTAADQTSAEVADAAASERWRLANRLQARPGLLGVFYKRDPSRFLRNLPPDEAGRLLLSLERSYRDLLLSYFRDPPAANQALENFVNTAFFSDLPVTRTVEIHLNLIDVFGKQLKLEGHKVEFLQDYRLALLDVMAHLCEMYRRSIPPDAPIVEPSQMA
jgi:circadian clock protein KaiA